MSGAVGESHEAWVRGVLSRLGLEGPHAAAPRTVSLDEIGEAIGLEWASPDRVEALFVSLEASGHRIGDVEAVDLGPWLVRTLAAARSERAAGRSVTPRALAEVTGLEPRQVRVALLYADVLARGHRAGP